MGKLAAFFSAMMLFALPWMAAPANASPSGQASVRTCSYQPGVSVPATMPPEVLNPLAPTPLPTSTVPAPTVVDAATTDRQLQVYQGLWNAVNDHYVYTDFLGHDWAAIGARYEALIKQGMSDEVFNAAMQAMVTELGDEHSYFQSAAEVAAETKRLAQGVNFVGIGALFQPIQETDHAAIIVVLPNSPAADAGLLPHDTLLQVDGGPIRDNTGFSRTRGPAGSSVTLTIQRPGQAAHAVTLTRRRVTGALPIDYCIIPGPRIGYILLPTLLDNTIGDQTSAALSQMTADGPLNGLVLDNRMNGGGIGSVAEQIMSLFTSGLQGYYISRDGQDALNLTPVDVGGSQTVPLVTLVGPDTVSYGEIVSGVLRLSGRSQIVGTRTLGNVEQLHEYDFEDGSRAWIATATFEPLGEANGIWEQTGIIPDVVVPTRWDLFTEADDPALAEAVALLTSS